VARKRDPRDELIAAQQATIAQLTALVTELKALMESAKAREEALIARLDAISRKAFGKSSEKMPPPAQELNRQRDDDKKNAAAKAKRKANEEQKAALKSKHVPHPIPEADRVCAACDCTQMREGPTAERVDYCYVPGYFRRRVHACEVLVCTRCGESVTAEAPPRPFEKSPYDAGLVAHVIVQKCACSVPIYRLEKQFKWLGIPMARSTMTDLFHAAAEKLKPLYQRLLYRVAHTDIVLADETTLAMQDTKKKGYMWTFRTDTLVAYKFSPSRSGKTPLAVLGGTKGTLLVDAFTGYNAVVDVDGRTRAACLAHVRRKFFEALPTAPESQEALDIILDVYRVEHRATEQRIVRTADHARMRDVDSRKAMKRLRAWLDHHHGHSPPKGPLGKAIRYNLDNWTELMVFLADVNVPVDNNASERALRIVALGRKNFLFVGHEEAGQNLAMLYSLTATCELHGADPHAYLADVLLRIDDHPHKRVDELLPDQWKTA
jgi:transposase